MVSLKKKIYFFADNVHIDVFDMSMNFIKKKYAALCGKHKKIIVKIIFRITKFVFLVM
jgi:hypothetical protein